MLSDPPARHNLDKGIMGSSRQHEACAGAHSDRIWRAVEPAGMACSATQDAGRTVFLPTTIQGSLCQAVAIGVLNLAGSGELQADTPLGTGATKGGARPLADLDLEDLLRVEVTSVTKTSGWWAESPAALYVISAEDIRRNNALTVPEALRQVPGLQVARTDSGGYAVSSRGLNERLNRQLLVLVDGRSVYSLLTSGVAWESLDVMMEDIDRIEVIRGPGATLFGANAVSGVINIVTRKARQTQGLLISGGGGTEVLGSGAIRYGGEAGDQRVLPRLRDLFQSGRLRLELLDGATGRRKRAIGAGRPIGSRPRATRSNG